MSKNDNTFSYQFINGYEVYYDKYYGYKGYRPNEDGPSELVYEINPDNGFTSIKTKNGYTLFFKNLTPEDIKPGASFINTLDGQCFFDGSVITKSTCDCYVDNDIYFDNISRGFIDIGDGVLETIYNENDYINNVYDMDGNLLYEIFHDSDESFYIKYHKGIPVVFHEYVDGVLTERKAVTDTEIINYYNIDDELCRIRKADGTYTFPRNSFLEIYPDGTYFYAGERGTYTVDKDGNIICKNSEGQQTFFDKYGKEYQIIFPDGSSIFYDEKLDSKRVIKDGKTTYSKINHIEYDEESYNKILNTLNGFEGSNIDGECDKIVDIVNGFPDSCSTSGIEDVKNDVKNHVNLIKSLSEMTNYSLLAYQTCDEELREGLYLLVDSLFSENEKELGERFKNAIKNTIEDRDNDKILEYKEGTNFKILSKNAIVSSIYTDEDGNKWYLNKNNRVIGIEGKDIKLKYGGETFNLTYDENGVVKLTDSNGKPLNIFGDYNLESKQYGGNQGDLQYAYNDQYVYDIVSGYFPNANMEEITDLITKSVNKSCGNVTMTNFIFKLSEGKEEEFYNTFGYPMYDIKYDSKLGLTVDYNYEPMIMDFVCEENINLLPKSITNPEISDLMMGLNGSSPDSIKSMIKYLQDKYNPTFFECDKEYYMAFEDSFTLRSTMDSVPESYNLSHAMFCVEKIDENTYIVSNQGEKFIMEDNSGLIYNVGLKTT